MRKPLLLGLDNPHSANPRAALLPRPNGSAGSRLFALSRMTWSEYRETFDRMNVVDASPEDMQSRLVLVLGKETWRRLSRLCPGIPRQVAIFDRVFLAEGGSLILIPHPSGRNLWYNKSQNRLRVTRLLRRLAR